MKDAHQNEDLIALGVRQPWAELIIRGVKTIEVRSLGTVRRGTIYVYAAKKLAEGPAVTAAAERHALDLESLPRGVLVGKVEIVDSIPCKPSDTIAACIPKDLLVDRIGWKLENPERLPTPLPVRFLPYGVWFYPYRRRNGATR